MFNMDKSSQLGNVKRKVCHLSCEERSCGRVKPLPLQDQQLLTPARGKDAGCRSSCRPPVHPGGTFTCRYLHLGTRTVFSEQDFVSGMQTSVWLEGMAVTSRAKLGNEK